MMMMMIIIIIDSKPSHHIIGEMTDLLLMQWCWKIYLYTSKLERLIAKKLLRDYSKNQA